MKSPGQHLEGLLQVAQDIWMTPGDGKRDDGKGDAPLQRDKGKESSTTSSFGRQPQILMAKRALGNLTSPEHGRIKTKMLV